MLRYPSSEIRITAADVDNLELIQRQLKEKAKQQPQEKQKQTNDEQLSPSSPSLSFTFGFMRSPTEEAPLDKLLGDVSDTYDSLDRAPPPSTKRKRTIQEQRAKITRQRLGLEK